jgi:hypothetical protein
VLHDRPVTDVDHEVTVRNQLKPTSDPSARLWEQTETTWAYCVCGWTAGVNGEPLPTDVVTTRAAQHLREAVTATMRST